MSRRDGFNSPNNTLVPDGRPLDQRPDTHSGYRLEQRRYMEPLPVSRGGQTFYQATPDVRNFPPAATSSAGSKQAPAPQPRRPQINQTGAYRKWGQQLPSHVQGPGRNVLNLNSSNAPPGIPSQIGLSKQQIDNHPSRRQGLGSRPQVRLPSIQQSNQPLNGSHQPMQGNQDISPINFNPNLKTRAFGTPSESKDVRPRNPIRRHRSSTSNSSKTSIGSAPWEPTFPSTQSSSPDPSRNDQTPQKSPSAPAPTAEDLDKEWLLLREESAKRPPPIEIDKYGHIPPLVRKWASVTVPEVRMGEPRWATSILSRKWEIEENWEKEKKELLAQKEQLGDESPTPFRPVTCMTKEQDRVNRIAELTLAMLHDMDDKDTNSKNTGMDENTSVDEKKASIIV